MVKRSYSSSSSTPSSTEETKPSAENNHSISDKSSSTESPRKPKINKNVDRTKTENKAKTQTKEKKIDLDKDGKPILKQGWTPEKKKIVAELILEAGFKSIDLKSTSELTGLTILQLRDALKQRHDGGTNLRSQLIASIIPK